MRLKKTIHIFGDSYSTGYGLNPDVSKIPDRYIRFRKYIWCERIIQFLKDYRVVNYAEPGSDCATAKDKLLANLTKIKQGDIVILGLTTFRRKSILVNKGDTFKPEYIHITGAHYIQYYENKISKTPVKDFVPFSLQYVCDLHRIPTTKLNTAFEYLDSFHFDDKIQEENQKYQRTVIKGITDFLNLSNVNMYVWDSTLWEVGEDIRAWSDNEYRDSHWSPNGNNFLLGFLLWGIHTNHRYLDSNLLNSKREEVDSFMSSKSLDKYIEHNLVQSAI